MLKRSVVVAVSLFDYGSDVGRQIRRRRPLRASRAYCGDCRIVHDLRPELLCLGMLRRG
jgi:hypothetical protein